MKNKIKTIAMMTLAIALAGFTKTTMAQSWSLNGNAGTDPAVNYIGTTDQKAFRIRTNNNNRISINGTGNVGIGTTSPAARLHLQGPGLWDLSTSEGDFKIGNSTYRLKIGVALAGGGAGDAYIAAQGGTSGIYIGSASSFNSLYSLSIKQGHIGIGGVGNAYRLETIGFDNSDTSTIGWFHSADKSKGVAIGQNSIYSLGTDDNIDLSLKSKGANGFLRFYHDNTEIANINEIGDLQIDQNNINNGTNTGGALRFGFASGEGISSKRTAGGNQYGLDFYAGGITTPRMSITNTGSVGIGTSSPASRFTVSGSESATHGNGAAIQISNNAPGGKNWYIRTGATGTGTPRGGISFADDGFYRFVIDTNGHAGINTNTTTTSRDLQVGTSTGSDLGIGSTETLVDSGSSWLAVNAKFTPTTNGTLSLGDASHRWSEVFAANGTINTSDARDKENITKLNYGLNDILKLNPVSFTWKDKADEGTKLGLIAQDLQKVLPEVVRDWTYQYNEENGSRTQVPAARLGVFYSDIIPVLINAVKEEHQLSQAKNARIDQLENENAEMKSRMDAFENALSLCCTSFKSEISNSKTAATITTDAARLESNVPNPFTQRTVIRFYVPQKSMNVSLKIYSLEGKEIKSFDVNQKGYGEITVEGRSLDAGVYAYTLIVDGKATDNKQMILTK